MLSNSTDPDRDRCAVGIGRFGKRDTDIFALQNRVFRNVIVYWQIFGLSLSISLSTTEHVALDPSNLRSAITSITSIGGAGERGALARDGWLCLLSG